MMSGAIQAMMAADTQMKVMANIENLIKATMRQYCVKLTFNRL